MIAKQTTNYEVFNKTMSLTSLLRDKNSYVYQWFYSRLNPAVEKIVDQHNNVLSRAGVVSKPPQDTNFPLVGSAYTYHIRHKLCGLDEVFAKSMASRGASIMMCNQPKEGIFNNIHKLCSSDKVEMLSFAYMLLAALEQVARKGSPSGASDFLLRFCKAHNYLPADDIEEKYSGTIEDLVSLINHTSLDICDNKLPQTRYLNPTFAGSIYVGGADAQLIVDGNLIDVRTTAKRRPFTVENLWQQIGYILLDFNNEYKIENACWYYSRQQILLEHPVEMLFKDLRKTREEFLTMLIDHQDRDFLPEIELRHNCPDDVREFFGF